MNNAFAKGAVLMVLYKLADRSLGLVTTLVLARILVPADFGIVAMAMAFVSVAELLTAFSLDAALIQRKDTDRTHYDTAWTLRLMGSVAAAIALLVLAPVAAWFYEEPRLSNVMAVLALGWVVHGFENVGIVAFRKELRFERDIALLLGTRLVSVIVTLACILWIQSYWAIVWGALSGRISGTLASYLISPFRPRFSLRARRDLLGFSSWLALNNALAVAIFKIPYFLVGRWLGAAALGTYSVGTQLAYFPSTDLVTPINRAAFPAYAKLAGDLPTLRNTYLKVLATLTLISLPAGVGLAAVAHPLVLVMLGSKWMAAVPFIKIVAFAGAIRALGTNNYAVYLALGRTRLPAFLSFAYLLIFSPLLWLFTVHYGLLGAAYAELAAALLYRIFVSEPLLVHTLKIAPTAFLAQLWRPALASAVMWVATTSSFLWLESLPPFLWLATAIVIGIVSYAIGLVGLWLLCGRPQGAETALLEQAYRFRRRYFASASSSPTRH